MLRRVVIFAAVAALVIVLALAAQLGYVSPTDALSISPIVGARATASTTRVASDEPSPPGGLGNSRDDLEHVYGSPTGLQGTMIAYRDGKYAATYVDDRATAVLVNDGDSPLKLAAARQATRALLPRDSVFVGTLRAGPSRIADVYRSGRLGDKVAESMGNASRGQFAVVYETDRLGAVKDVLLTVGGVPPSQ